MNLHQFRFIQEAVRRNLNLTDTARALHTSQPGVSKAIIELEQELGIQIFARHGKRLRNVTEPGQHVVDSVAIILREIDNLRRIGEQYSARDFGTLSIATTHSQARYVLPRAVTQLRTRYPKVNVSLHQGTPDQVARMVINGGVDLGIATESVNNYSELITLPCYEWQHVLVVRNDHPLAQKKHVTLADIAAEELVTYHPSFTGRTRIDAAFARHHLTPNVALEAIDSDVIKTYVRLGLGVGIVAEMAIDKEADRDLCARPLGRLIGHNITRIALRRGAYLRDFVYYFMHQLSDRLDKDMVQKAMNGQASDYAL